MKSRYIILGLVCSLAMIDAVGQQQLSLSLADCRKMALSSSEEMRQRELGVRKADFDRKIANAAFLPKIDGSATGAYMVPDIDMMGMEMRMRGTYMAGITLTQPIYAGGRILTGKKLAKIGQESAQIQQEMTRMDILAEADKAYWTYIAVDSKVRMLESYVRQMDHLYTQTEDAVAVGMGTNNDLLRIASKRSEIRYQLQKANNGKDLCRLSLCRLLGVDNATEIIPSDTAISIEQPQLEEFNPGLRPEIKLLQKQVEANRHQVTMAKAEMLPTVGLSAGYTYYGNLKLHGMTDLGDGNYYPYTQEFRDGIGMFMLSVQIPIFSWGERSGKVKKARLEVENSTLELEKNSKLINLEVEQASRNLTDAYLLIATAKDGMSQSEENLRVMKDRYDLKLSTLTDLLDAQSQWRQAESNLIEAKTQYKISETEYLRVLGVLE